MMDAKYMVKMGLADTMTNDELSLAGISKRKFNEEREKAKNAVSGYIQKRINSIKRKYKNDKRAVS